jgi:hypothetical protein
MSFRIPEIRYPTELLFLLYKGGVRMNPLPAKVILSLSKDDFKLVASRNV